MTDFTRGFRLHLRHGQVLDGAAFPSGRCLVLDDPEFGLTTAAASEEDLLRGYPDARIEWPANDAAAPTPPSLTEGLREQYAAAIYERNNPPLRWAEAHPDDVLAYGSDADAALTVRDRELEQARAEVTRLHEGEEPYVHEHTEATPAQWIWQWNRATPEERLDMAARIKDASARASACFMGGHEVRLDELAATLERVRTALDDRPPILNAAGRGITDYETGWRDHDGMVRAALDGQPQPATVLEEQPEDTCRPVEIDGELIRVRGSGEMSDESRAALAEVIQAAKRRYLAEHPEALEEQPARECICTPDACPPHCSCHTEEPS